MHLKKISWRLLRKNSFYEYKIASHSIKNERLTLTLSISSCPLLKLLELFAADDDLDGCAPADVFTPVLTKILFKLQK